MNVYDISAEACAAMKANGSQVCETVQEVSQKSDYVITMLPNSDIVYNTYAEIAQSKLNENTIFIDSSTIDPNVARKVQI